MRSLLEVNYGTSDMDVHFYENSSRVELAWNHSPTLSIRNTTSLLYADRLWRMGPTGYAYQPATNDVLRSDYGIWAQHQIQWSNQFDVTSKQRLAGRSNTLLVGVSADHFDYTRRVTLWPGQSDVVPLFAPPKFGAYPATGAVNTNAANNLVNRVALYAEDHFEVAPRLALVGGVRFDAQHFERINLLSPTGETADRTDTPVNPRVGAVYTVYRSTNVYAQFSQATDAPDYLFCCGSAAAVRTLEPTSGRQFEAGIKQATDRVEWTVAGYRIVKTNLLIYDQTSGVAERYIQAGAQSSRGVEATLAVSAGHGLSIGANGTVLKPQFDDLVEFVDGQAVVRNGNKPPNVPWQSGNLLVSWIFRPDWMAQGAFRFVGKRYIDTANTESLALPGYRVLDATVSWNATKKVGINFRAMNLSNAFYPVTVTGDGQGGANWIAGAPRTFELELRAGF
jgi:iron complex outermembrane receptor protein